MISRRHFARLSALSLAGAALARSSGMAAQSTVDAPAPKAANPVGFACVGLGTISGIFMRALAQCPTATLTGLVTGEPGEKGAHFAAQYGVPTSSIYSYATYDQLRQNKAIEAVYIGLPNSMHCEYTVRAAEAGKHVLCEKPMAISSAECRRMIDACRRNNVRLMIAYRVWYDPMFERAHQLVTSGALGQIQSFEGAFIGTQPAGAWRLTKALGGGGSLMDLGIYPLNAIRYFTGEEPADVTAVTSTRDHSGKFALVEQNIQWTMRMPSGIIASCASSYGAQGGNYLDINGEQGSLRLEPAYSYDGLRMTGNTRDGKVEYVSDAKLPYQFVAEAAHFAACVRSGATPRTPGELGLADMVAIERIYAAAGAPIA